MFRPAPRQSKRECNSITERRLARTRQCGRRGADHCTRGRVRVARSERCKSASGRSSSPGKPKGLRWRDSTVGSNGGKLLVRRITNPIRPDVLGEPASGERSPKLDEDASSLRSMPVLSDERKKSQVGHIRWVGTEWWEDRAHEAGNPAGATGPGPLIGRKPCPAQVRVSVVAKKRVTTVEPRDTGR